MLGSHAADGRMGALLATRPAEGRGDVPRGARGRSVGRGRRDPWARVALARRHRERASRRSGDEEEVLRVGLEALAVGEDAGQPFTAAVAHETVAASMRRLMRLDEALEHAEAAIRTFRELGARWELASALGDRGAIHRVAGRLEEAESDLREAFVLCRDLQERALVTWTAAELARILATRGDPSAARQVLHDPTARLADGEPGSSTALLHAEVPGRARRGRRGDRPGEGRAAIEAETGPRRRCRTRSRRRSGGPDGCSAPRTRAGARSWTRPRAVLERHHWLRPCASPIWPPTCGDRPEGRSTPADSATAQGTRCLSEDGCIGRDPGGACGGVGPVANPSLGPVWVDAHT